MRAALAGAVRGHPLVAFFALAYAVSWSGWLLAGADATPALLRIGLTWLLALGVTAATGARHLTRGPVAPPVAPPAVSTA